MRFHRAYRFLQDFPSRLHHIHRSWTWFRRIVVWQDEQWDTRPLNNAVVLLYYLMSSVATVRHCP